MNNERRKATELLEKQVESLRPKVDAFLDAFSELCTDMRELAGDIENLRDEEQEYIDNLPEGLADSDKAQNAEASVNWYDEALLAIGNAIDLDLSVYLDGIISYLNDARSA